jgi:type I restriction enzyme S subunit
MKPGYKQTEVGVIPEDWEVSPLRSVLTKGRLGGNYPNQDRETEFPLMKMGNLARGKMVTSKVEYITQGVRPEAQHKLTKGDVLFNTRNTLDLVGKVAIWRDELPLAYYNSNLMRLEFDPRQVCSNEYANAALNTSGALTILRGLATGTTSVAAIYTRDLLEMLFITPPLPEQRAIAAALSDVDGLLGALDRLIAKKRDLKQAAMQQLLTGQTRLPGFKGEWVVKTFGEVCWFQEGPSVRNTQFTTSGVKLLNGTNIFRGVLNLDTTTRFIAEKEAYGSYAHFMADEGDIVLASSGITIERLHEKVAFVRRDNLPFCMNTSTIRFKPLEGRLVSSFLFQVLIGDEFKSQIGGEATGSAQLNFGPSHVTKVCISLPPLPEQTAIASVLSEMDAELAALEQRRDKTCALKQGMMQELLTGRTRLL